MPTAFGGGWRALRDGGWENNNYPNREPPLAPSRNKVPLCGGVVATPPGWSPQNAHRPRAPRDVSRGWNLGGGWRALRDGGWENNNYPNREKLPPSPRRGIKSRDGNKIPRRGAGINTAGFFIQPKYLHNSWHPDPHTESQHCPW